MANYLYEIGSMATAVARRLLLGQKLSIKLALGACLAWASYGAAFQNGSFELGINPNSDLPGGSTAITGWVVTGGLIAWVNGDGAGGGPSDGTYFVDLNGCAPPESLSCIVQGGIRQTFDTTVGTSYTVKFDLHSNNDPFFGPPVANTVQVSAAGTSQSFLTPVGGWQTFTFMFTATASQTTLAFVSLSPGTAGPELDNVRVSAQAANLAIVPGSGGGNQQTGDIGTLLVNPLVVKTTNPDGSVAPNVAISFAVVPPSGATGTFLTNTTATTGADGTASTQLSLGDLSGQYQVTASCSGTQTCAPPSLTFTETAIGPQISVAPTSIDFGSVALNDIKIKRLTVENTGLAGTTLTGTLAQPSLPFSLQSGCTSFALSTGTSCSVDVAYSPSAAGQDIGTIDIASNDAINPAFSLPLTGTGGCNSNFDVSGLILPRSQPSPSSCWATAGAIMVTWHTGTPQTEMGVANLADNVPPTVTIFADQLNNPNPDDQGLVLPQLVSYLTRLSITGSSAVLGLPSVCDIANLLQTFGPLWVVTGGEGVPGSPHAQVIVGIDGDGTQAGTSVRVIDPASGSINNIGYVNLIATVSLVTLWPQWMHF